MTTHEIMQRAKKASKRFFATADEKNAALINMADSLEAHQTEILAANGADVAAARGNMSEVMIDRLLLTPERIHAMACGMRDVARLHDPVGEVLSEHKHPGGMLIRKVCVPMGVVAIIYESRPNVTSDAASLALKSGNACILRSGKEAHASAEAITNALREGLSVSGMDSDLVQLVSDTSRESSYELMRGNGYIDLLIPRGGKGLIKACVENATVPCIKTGTGICHIYVDKAADIEKALNIVENDKTSRPSVCNAAEVCLVHESIAEKFLPMLEGRLVEKRAAQGKPAVELRADGRAIKYLKTAAPAGGSDFDTEFLDYILAVGVVDSVESAVMHISAHSTHHSDAIITEDAAAAECFTRSVDSAAVYVNASTRFTDGGEFGLGCEMGISTQKLHARGPMGIRELTTYKYIVTGNGNIR